MKWSKVVVKFLKGFFTGALASFGATFTNGTASKEELVLSAVVGALNGGMVAADNIRKNINK